MDFLVFPEFDILNKRFREAFGEGIPTMMLPAAETIEGLTKSVEKSIAAGRNLLPEIYCIISDGSILY